jgi:ankyrin repeat protein
MDALDNLKKEAKRWLKSLREGDEEALARFRRAHPEPPAEPTLRDVQLAVARERGAPGWAELKTRLQAPQVAAWFLEQACPDWRTGGPSAQAAAQAAAMRLLERHPEIARASIYTAVVCGELREVERILAADPRAASHRGGPKDWEPLHYLCFARLPLAAANENAAAIVRLLLDAGADPNASFQIGMARHSPLVGIVGEGEERRAPHPRLEALLHLLLQRGASPCDTQVIYNVTQGDHPCRWLETLYDHSVRIGAQAEWTRPKHFREPKLNDLDWLLCDVVPRNDAACAVWLLERGADPNAQRPWRDLPLYAEASRRGFREMAELLLRYGAVPASEPLTTEEEYVAACLRMDREAVRTMLREHSELLASPAAIFAAAGQDRADVVEFLLDLGTPIEVEDAQKQRPLHIAAQSNAVRTAQLLIDRGAEIDARESQWGGTALGNAHWGARREAIDLLSRYSRDVWELVPLGKLERLREVLHERSELARVRADDGLTLLMMVRQDDREMVELLLANGADPAARLEDGRTAADLLRRRGLEEAARLVAASLPTSSGS